MKRSTPNPRSARALVASLGLLLGALLLPASASAAPEAHILRIDPRAGVTNGAPVLTSVVEVVQFNRLSDALQPCASVTGYDATLDCWSKAIEKPGALWSPFPFPEQNARFLVKVNGEDLPMSFVQKEAWGQVVGKSANVGTAWLIALDASSSMGARYNDARVVADAFIEAMGPNDLMDLMIFDDRARQYVADSKWKTFKERDALVGVLNQVKSPMPSHGPDRPLFSQIQQMTQDAFGDLGGSKAPDTIPLHQAMVVLSNGVGRGDAASAAPSAEVFHQYLNQGRFPADNTSLPKTPLPVVSVWFPTGSGVVNDLYRNNDSQFMQSLANTEIGGFFDIVRAGQGEAKAKTIHALVKQRFDAMWIVKWRLACLNPTVEQSFNLVFVNTKPLISPDGSFKDVPIGVDPSQWPLDVDVQKTLAEAQANPVYPGGKVRVYGDFCWSGDKSRAEAYFVPAGTRADPNANSTDPQLAKQAMQQLIAQNMRGAASDVGDTFAEFTVPDDDKVLEGTGDNAVARLVVYDNKAHRASGHDEKSVLTLKAKKAPFNLLIVAGVVGLVVVVLLLLLVLFRGGGGGKRGRTPPPRGPIGGGGGGSPYGAPPGGGYGAPQGNPGGAGGYRAQAMSPVPAGPGFGVDGRTPFGSPAANLAGAMAMPMGAGMSVGMNAPAMNAMSPLPPSEATVRPIAPQLPGQPQARLAQAPSPAAAYEATAFQPIAPIAPDLAARVVEVQCPSCGMKTMAAPGQTSVCFSCGQPLPASVLQWAAQAGGEGGGGAFAPTFPLTGGIPAARMPPANPYAAASGATILGAAGQFSIRPGAEVRVGRDPAQCPVRLDEPRVSGVHATLKFEGGQLWVRDETSNNGTYVQGARIPSATWIPVASGGQLKFGPIEFSVRFDG